MASGLGTEPNSISGYFYASRMMPWQTIRAYAVFNDPNTDLLNTYDHSAESRSKYTPATGNNVSVGNVTFGGYACYSQMASPTSLVSGWLHYSTNFTSSGADPSAVWTTGGNGGFKAVTANVTRGFPVMTETLLTSATSSASISKGYTLNITGKISNHDSVIVSFTDPNFTTILKRSFSSSAPIIFTPSELSVFANPNFTYSYITISALNYSNQMVAGKKYVFELLTRIPTYTFIFYP
jgi:hypothetical protein